MKNTLTWLGLLALISGLWLYQRRPRWVETRRAL
jgi:LPXTG-motif cell wall-anchored protein